MSLALAVAGFALVVVALLDVIWTTVAGVAVVLIVLPVWIGFVLAGWMVVFSSVDGAVRSTGTGAPADLTSRAYFVGYTVFTLGNGDYRPGAGTWQLATVIATGTGLLLVTLAITYLVPVASAVADRRMLAGYINGLGTSPRQILIRAWAGRTFGHLAQHLASMTLPLQTSPTCTSAPPPLPCGSTGRTTRPTTVWALDTALDRFLETLEASYLSGTATPLEPPDIEPLRAALIPTVDDEIYAAARKGTERRRRMLASMLSDDGWSPSDLESAAPTS